MLVKDIEIDGKNVRFAASASITRLYRKTFGRDILIDMSKIAGDVQLAGSEDNASQIPVESLELFENVAYIMACKADKTIPSVDEWLDQFDTFSIYAILPEIMKLWNLNNKTFSVPKKK